MKKPKLNPAILRQYDIRGTYLIDLCQADAHAIGIAYAKQLNIKQLTGKVVVGRDGRLSSPMLRDSLIQGLNAAGVDVVDIGIVPTPVLYFATSILPDIAGGIMVTGSHNPADQNGFKLMMDGKPMCGEEIQTLGTLANDDIFSCGKGKLLQAEVGDAYLKFLGSNTATSGRQFKAVWDPGHGAGATLLGQLLGKLPGEHILINGYIDGSFPAHAPNPSDHKNMAQLINMVRTTGSNFGFAFDGDGDRLAMVDSYGKIIGADQLLIILALDALHRYPGAPIVIDVKMGNWVAQYIKSHGGVPIFCRTGHSFIKNKMKAEKAILGGEMSGHLFFAEDYSGFDDGMLAAAKLLSILSTHPQTLDEILQAMPQMFSVPEIAVPCVEAEKSIAINKLRDKLIQAGTTFVDLDGVRCTTDDGWWLVRASNTEAHLSVRLESDCQAGLKRLQKTVSQLLIQVGIDAASVLRALNCDDTARHNQETALPNTIQKV